MRDFLENKSQVCLFRYWFRKSVMSPATLHGADSNLRIFKFRDAPDSSLY